MQLSKVVSESALQAQHRIVGSERINALKNLNNHLFFDNGPQAGQIVQILGESNVGKTALIIELIAKTILPTEYGGRNAGVYLLETLFGISLPQLMNVMKKLAAQHFSTTPIDDDRIKESLKNLILIRCYSLDDIDLSVLSINEKLGQAEYSKYALVILDTISAFYWQECTDISFLKIDTYMRNLLKDFEKLCATHQITFVFTRLKSFASPGQTVENKENYYCIELIGTADEEGQMIGFTANAPRNGKSKTVPYRIASDGIHWGRVSN